MWTALEGKQVRERKKRSQRTEPGGLSGTAAGLGF